MARWAWVLLSMGLALAQPVPKLPFPDNPDPRLCGIPTPWKRGDPAWLDGHYQGKLVQPVVLLYDSHARGKIVGRAKTGTPVKILLFQANPRLNYYLVRTLSRPVQEGWVPEPFLRLKR